MQKANGDLVPGGLAMVIGSVHKNSEYIGSTVTLVRSVRHRLGDAWLVEGPSNDPFKDKALSRHLMPINPEADPLHVSEREKCQA